MISIIRSHVTNHIDQPLPCLITEHGTLNPEL